jgi:D-alanine--poly(phosphoribitol) ligase subunit 1
MSLFKRYYEAFRANGQNEAFCFEDDHFTYADFLSKINGIRGLMESDPDYSPETPVGVICYEDIETYASVFAIWFSGCYFVPLNPAMPGAFNNEIIARHNIRLVLSSKVPDVDLLVAEDILLRTDTAAQDTARPAYNWYDEQVVYVLNTSGSTGKPKYVPINLKNLTAYVDGFLFLYPELGPADKFLQTYDLTSDGAFTGYLIPFMIGASVYTISQKYFKPLAVARVLNSKPITWVKLTPSLLACLRPYFSSFNLPGIKHFLFGGEALPLNLVEDWRKSVPNVVISNLYGPTETSVTAIIYKCAPGEELKSLNNTISIGKPLRDVVTYINSETSVNNENTGELCIAGEQVMAGYWFSEHQPFIFLPRGESQVKYYPTGDQVKMDAEGNFYYLGRNDDQVKINGYRVDLIEVENIVREHIPDCGNLVAAKIEVGESLSQLVVFVENYRENDDKLANELAMRYPRYKIPEKIIGVKTFPLLTSGKTDRKALVDDYFHKKDK